MELEKITELDFHAEHPAFAAPLAVLISFSVLMGTCGNILLIVSILTTKELRVPGNYLVLSLATADLIVSAVIGPMHLIGLFGGETFFLNRPGLCNAVACICLIVCFSSVLSITAIACNRYISVVHPSVYDSIYTPLKTVFICISLWIVGFCFEMPHFELIGWGGRTFEKKTQSCLWDRQASRSYTIFFAAVPIGLPLFATFLFYLGIFVHVRRNVERISRYSNRRKSRVTPADAKEMEKSLPLAKTMGFIYLLFLFFWAPYAVIVVADKNDTFSAYIHGPGIVFAHLNSALSFFIYGLFNTSFRKAYSVTLTCGRYKWEPATAFTLLSMNANKICENKVKESSANDEIEAL